MVPYTEFTVNFHRIARFATQSVAAICLTGLSVMSYAQSADINGPTVGDKIPDVVLRGTDGSDVKLRTIIKGRNTVLVFYSAIDQTQVQDLQSIRTRLDHRGYQVVAISMSDPQDLGQGQLSYKILSGSSSDLMNKLGVSTSDNSGEFVLFTNTEYGVSYVQPKTGLKAPMSGVDIIRAVDNMPCPVDVCWD